jgi:cysteine desulfurase
VPLKVDALGCDLLTLSSHKMGGPKGVGALYIRRGTPMNALLRGGAQERGRRAGTENVPGIVGMGVAAHEAREELNAESARLGALRTQLETDLKTMGARINGDTAPRAPHITNATFPGARAETLALNLDLRGFALGTGSACASGAIEPSHVLTAMGLDGATAKSSLRISLGRTNSQDDVRALLKELLALLAGSRELHL